MPRRDTSVKTKLFSTGVCIRKFSRLKSGRPEPNVQHFFEKPVEDTQVGVVVPIYNEQATDLRKTLLSIDMQVNYMRSQRINITPHVMLVQDGVAKASDSMKKYLRNMFDLDEGQFVREFESEDKSAPYQTFILQKLKNSHVTTVDINAGYKTNQPVNMIITLIIKKDNRKKHNSHEWFLGESGFVNYYRPKYSLCTDCSTLFHKACLLRLYEYMERNPKCSVSTGRQRVMTKEMQGDPDEPMFSVASLLRHAQRFDYEASFVCYTGTFSAVGFLPVVPGPCGLYRTEVLVPAKGYKGSPAEWYFDVVNTDPDKSGLVLGNLRIAEDRVLSYSVVLKSEAPSEMGLVPQAVFYFEAETNLKSLVLQRRRWINGTWAGYWYLAIQHPDLIFKCNQIGFLKKLFVWFLLLCQLAIYFVVALAPSIFLGALRLTLSIVSSDSQDSILAIAFWLLLVLLYLYFIWHHHYNTYLGYLFNIWLAFSAILSIASITSFIIFVVRNRYLLEPRVIRNVDFTRQEWTDALTVWIIITILVLPLIIAIIADGRKSIVLMLRSIIPYYLVLPMVVGFFAAYSFSRCWDLTWGNRPTEDDPAHRAAKQKEEDLKTQSATLAAFIAIANVFFFFAQVLVLNADGGKLYLSLVIFATTLLQMFIGLLWFSLYRFKYFFTSTYYWLRNCRHRKKFVYQTYGDEEDDSEKDIDVHTLYYDDNNDSDEDEGDIADEDDFVDYYDPDSRAIVLVDGPLQRHMSVTAIALPPHLMQAAKAPIPVASRGSPIHHSPSPSPASLVVDTSLAGGFAPSPRAGLPPSPRASSPRSPGSSFLGAAPNTVFQPIIVPKSPTEQPQQPQYTVPLAPLIPSLRPKLSRSTHSAYGVSFAPTPIVVSLNSRAPVNTLSVSNPNTPIVQASSAIAPPANPATTTLKSRVRSTSMPQLPPSFFVNPPPDGAELPTNSNNNNNTTTTTNLTSPPRISAPPTNIASSPLKRSFNAQL